MFTTTLSKQENKILPVEGTEYDFDFNEKIISKRETVLPLVMGRFR